MSGILLFILIIFAFGFLLSFASEIFKVKSNPLVEKINEILPQTQCGQCGYAGCKPYAMAISKEEAPINQCPPGGQQGIKALAELLGVEEIELNAENGEEKDAQEVAFIKEDECIGCTICIQNCPVDAILGAAKKMHTIIADECTGCELCVAPCPVDCIVMLKKPQKINEWIIPIPNKIPLRLKKA